MAKQIGYSGSAGSLAGSVTATGSQTTDFITITAVQPTSAEAAKVANAFAHEFVVRNSGAQQAVNNKQIAALRHQIGLLKGPKGSPNYSQRIADIQQIEQLQLANSAATGSATQIDVAQGGAVIGHGPAEYAALAAIAALVGSILLAYMLHRLDPRMNSVGQAAEIYSHPVLATIVHDSDILHFADGEPGLSARSKESFRDLRVSLDLGLRGQRLKTVMVTSAGSSEGKSTVARNLGLALAETGRRVALVDTDLRKSSLAKKLGTDAEPGLTEVVAGENTLEEVQQSVSIETAMASSPEEAAGVGASESSGVGRVGNTITLIPAGKAPPNPVAVLESSAFRSLLQQVVDQHDIVVIDTTPLTAVSDALPLVGQVDAVVLVARSDKTDRRTARRASELIERVPGANIVGVVVNGVPTPEAVAYGYGYGYGYGAEKTRRAAKVLGTRTRGRD